MSQPFIIWTLQRTGGTALATLLMDLSEHPQAEHEPFNWSRDQPRQFWPVVEAWMASGDGAALGRALDEVLAARVLIKHCYDLFNMAFNVALLEATIRAGYRHILLVRRDEAARLVSKFIAETQGSWFEDYGRQVYAELSDGRRQLGPIPVDQVVAQFRHARNSASALRRAAAERGAHLHESAYEDLYLADRDTQARCFAGLVESLDLPAEPSAAAIADFVGRTKAGGRRTSWALSHVPNIEALVEGLAAAGCPMPTGFVRRGQLKLLVAQLSQGASARGWLLLDNLDRDWPGLSFRFDQASSLEFRVESADMSFNNVYFGVKNAQPIHNKSLGETLAVTLGPATYSTTWPWCRHPHTADDLLPIGADWAMGDTLDRGVPDGSLAARLFAAADRVRAVLGAFGYIATEEAEWARLQSEVSTPFDRHRGR